MNYNVHLYFRFKDLEINLVKHDVSPTGLPCYIEAHLKENPKSKEDLVLDLGNYIYRFLGLTYQHTPEFMGKGKNTTVRWFMSWQDVAAIQKNICEASGSKILAKDWLPVEFTSLIIQNSKKGVIPPYCQESFKDIDNE